MKGLIVHKERTRYIDIFFATALLFLVVWPAVDSKAVPYLVPIVLLLIGLAFLLSTRFKNSSIVARTFSWISYNVIVPRSEKSYLIWGGIFMVFGVTSLFYFVNRRVVTNNDTVADTSIQDFQSWWYKDPVLWVVIALLVVIGVYRARSKKQ
jgi:hypothetical protein